MNEGFLNFWAAMRGEVRAIYVLSPIDPDKVLQSFYAEVRKPNGEEYEPIPLQVCRLVLTDI